MCSDAVKVEDYVAGFLHQSCSCGGIRLSSMSPACRVKSFDVCHTWQVLLWVRCEPQQSNMCCKASCPPELVKHRLPPQAIAGSGRDVKVDGAHQLPQGSADFRHQRMDGAKNRGLQRRNPGCEPAS